MKEFHRQEDADIIDKLVGFGLNINSTNYDGETPLQIAIAPKRTNFDGLGSYEMIRYLLDNGADCQARNSVGRTALPLSVMDVWSTFLAQASSGEQHTANCVCFKRSQLPCKRPVVESGHGSLPVSGVPSKSSTQQQQPLNIL